VTSDVGIFPFSDRVEVAESGCWLWTGGTTSAGYGQVRGGTGGQVYVHRVAYEIAKGPIPDGLVIDHLCFVVNCVNPDHLEAVTQAENARRAFRAGLWFPRVATENAQRTHCRRGHEFTPENTYVWRNHRTCVICRRARQKRSRANKTPAPAPSPEATGGPAIPTG
jgi:hypothetical protein